MPQRRETNLGFWPLFSWEFQRSSPSSAGYGGMVSQGWPPVRGPGDGGGGSYQGAQCRTHAEGIRFSPSRSAGGVGGGLLSVTDRCRASPAASAGAQAAPHPASPASGGGVSRRRLPSVPVNDRGYDTVRRRGPGMSKRRGCLPACVAGFREKFQIFLLFVPDNG